MRLKAEKARRLPFKPIKASSILQTKNLKVMAACRPTTLAHNK
jgi:hypothetical protein